MTTKPLPWPVHLEKPVGRHGWRMSYVSAEDTFLDNRTPGGRLKKRKETLQCQGGTKADDKRRQDELRRKAREQDRLYDDLVEGRVTLDESGDGSPLSVGEGLDLFYSTVGDAVTLKSHRAGVERFKVWCAKNGVQTCDQITRGQLMRFRRDLLEEKRDKDWAPRTFNKYLSSVRTAATYLFDEDRVPGLAYDDFRRIKLLKERTKRKPYSSRAEVRQILEAALRYDRATFATTRWVPGQGRPTKRRYPPIAPFAMFQILSTMRPGESRELGYVKPGSRNSPTLLLDQVDWRGDPVGVLIVPAEVAKTRTEREIGLRETPYLRTLLDVMKLQSGGQGKLFGFSENDVNNAARRLRNSFGAPHFSWYYLRRSSLTHLYCSSVYAGASAAMTAARGGHDVRVCQKRYAGQVHGIDPELRTLEAVLGIEDLCQEIVDEVKARGKVRQLRSA